jgi:hypothetical protein
VAVISLSNSANEASTLNIKLLRAVTPRVGGEARDVLLDQARRATGGNGIGGTLLYPAFYPAPLKKSLKSSCPKHIPQEVQTRVKVQGESA